MLFVPAGGGELTCLRSCDDGRTLERAPSETDTDLYARAEALIPELAGVNVGMYNEIRAGA